MGFVFNIRIVIYVNICTLDVFLAKVVHVPIMKSAYTVNLVITDSNIRTLGYKELILNPDMLDQYAN